jgi:hypothetical protein
MAEKTYGLFIDAKNPALADWYRTEFGAAVVADNPLQLFIPAATLSAAAAESGLLDAAERDPPPNDEA